MRHVFLTGASGGLGRALAAADAAAGERWTLVGQNAEALAETARLVAEAGAEAVEERLDVRDRQAMEEAVARAEEATPLTHVLAFAGVSTGLGPGRGPERRADSRRTMEVNVGGVLNAVEPALPALLARGAGHVVLMSSVAAIRPIADMPSYSASKAWVRAYGVSLRGMLRPKGVAVTTILPGFVSTAMAARHKGAKPFEMAPERAARIMVRGIAARRAEVIFPLPLAITARLGMLLPPALADRAASGFRARIEPDGRE